MLDMISAAWPPSQTVGAAIPLPGGHPHDRWRADYSLIIRVRTACVTRFALQAIASDGRFHFLMALSCGAQTCSSAFNHTHTHAHAQTTSNTLDSVNISHFYMRATPPPPGSSNMDNINLEIVQDFRTKKPGTTKYPSYWFLWNPDTEL